MRTFRLPCGCVASRDREAILKMCPACQAEFDAIHIPYMAERRAQLARDNSEVSK